MAIIVLTTIDMADGSAAGLKAIIPQQPGIPDLLGTAFSSMQRLRFQNIGSHSLLHTHGILQNLLLCYINSKFYSKHLHTLFDVKYSGSRRTGIKGAIIGDVCFVESWVTRPATVIAPWSQTSNTFQLLWHHKISQSNTII